MSKLLHVFWETDMRAQHAGLAEKMKEERKFDISRLKEGDLVAFINRKKDKIKLLAGLTEEDSYGVMAYYKSPHGRKIDEMAIQFIPDAFQGGRVNMDSALKKAIEKRFEKRAASKLTIGPKKIYVRPTTEKTGATT